VPAVVDATVVSRMPAVPAVPYGGGLVVMSIEHGRYVGLDDIGTDIWSRIEQPRSAGELIDQLAGDYDAPRETIAAQVGEWLCRMAEAAIIRLS